MPIAGLVAAEDEVVVIEPVFQQYIPHVQLGGAKLRSAKLDLDENGEWQLDFESLEAALSEKTRVLMFTTPHNPTGKVFTREEMQRMSDLLDKYPRCLVISDEVYGFVTFGGREHQPFANLGHNWDRTVTIYSGGKMLNCAGWKVGWAIGPAPIIRQATLINDAQHQVNNVPGQVAMAKSMQWYWESEYRDGVRNGMEAVAEVMYEGLQNVSLPIRPLKPQGGYFLVADVEQCRSLVPQRYFESNEYEDDPHTRIQKIDFGLPVSLDLAFNRWMMMEYKVAAMPVSLFFDRASPYKSDRFLRIALCRGMDAAVNTLKRLRF